MEGVGRSSECDRGTAVNDALGRGSPRAETGNWRATCTIRPAYPVWIYFAAGPMLFEPGSPPRDVLIFADDCNASDRPSAAAACPTRSCCSRRLGPLLRIAWSLIDRHGSVESMRRRPRWQTCDGDRRKKRVPLSSKPPTRTRSR